MSSHREAPEISKDPVADNTDVYAFVSPDKPDTVTLIANYIPLQGPPAGPNFYVFGDDVLYEIHVSNAGTAASDISYQFRFTTQVQDPNTFLYNTGPITSLTDATYNRRQVYSVTRVKGGVSTVLASGLLVPPCNIGPHSTPDYASLAEAAVHTLPSGETVFAGQRAEGFFADLGAIFDLGDLRPFQELHTGPLAMAAGFDTLQGLNINTIAIQVPKKMLTKDGSTPTNAASATSVIGVYATASRQATRVYDSKNGGTVNTGPFVQVSRLGNPLINEVIVPIGKKDYFNATAPSGDSQFIAKVEQPELAMLLPVLYPGVFPNLAKLTAPRKDLVAILLTGLPAGIVPNFQNNTGTTQADMLRLNMAIPPTASPNPAGLVAGDAAGFPNGRRLVDDVVTIELRAIAGLTYPLVDKSYTPDAAVSKVTDGATMTNSAFLPNFPYLGVPNSGFYSLPGPTNTGTASGATASATGSGSQMSATPSGAPQTGGGGTAAGRDSDLLFGAAAGLATAVAAGQVAAHQHGRRDGAPFATPVEGG